MVHLAPALLAGLVGLAGLTAAHPGHDVKAEAAERASFLKRAPTHHRSLKHCAQKLRSRGYEARNVARRELTVERLRRRKGLQSRSTYLKARDLEDALNTDHHSSLNLDQNVDPAVLFASNATCILGPDTTQGPYYVTGELIRKDITDNEPGVPLYLDFQIIDTNTCNPVPNIYLDAWHCNATGVYSGVVAKGNGNINDKSNIDATFGRGVQKTDSTGVAQFETIFPGHYTGRTHHIHLLSHAPNGTSVNANHTLSDLRTAHASYVSQVYFDQDLIYEVEETAAYVPNKQPLTTNAEDYILREEAEFIDPFMQYVYLGDSIDDGLFAWISLGIDGTKSSNVAPAVWYTENGGIENPDFGGEGPGGPPPA